jgi:lipoprotein-anchoring transpeptidase ErfK/SrfK
VWLPLDSAGLGKNGLGIHGYSGPDAKWGAMVSNGCIRLPNDKAEELFFTISHPDRSPTTVEIVD